MIKWILSSSVLIGAVIGLRYLFRGKISARLQYALWALVLVRLLMPSGIFSMPFSVENLVGTIQSQPVVQDVITDLHEPGLTYEEAFEQAKIENLPEDRQGLTAEEYYHVTVGNTHARAAEIMRLSTPTFVLKSIFMGAWYLGIAVVAIVFLVSNIKFSITLRRKRQLLRKEKVRIYTCEGLNTPCLFGLFRPAIYLAPEDAEDEQRLEHIIAHELTHRKHWDHIWSFLRCACLAIHWYNPLVWIASILSRQDGELACDEATIKKLGEEQRIPYGETLVQTTCAAKPTTGILGIATTMTGSKEAIKQRILRIAKKFKFNVYAFISVILVAAISIGCTWFGAIPDNEIVTVYLLKGYTRTNLTYPYSTRHNEYYYDGNYNLIGDKDGTIPKYEYSKNNRLIYKAYRNNPVEYYYNASGQISQCIEDSKRYIYTYNEQGLLIHSECAHSREGFTADYSYDSNGTLRESRKVTADGTVTRRFYNAAGNLTKEERQAKGCSATWYAYTYDSFGRLIARTAGPNADYNNISYTYDLAGRLVKEVFGDKRYTTPIIKDENIHITYAYPAPYTKYYHYDLRGHLTQITTEYPSSTARRYIIYDLYGRLKRVSYDETYDFRFSYDGNGNMLSESYYNKEGDLVYLIVYNYVAVQVPQKDAERLLAQQEELNPFPSIATPPDPMPEKEQFYP